MILSRISSQGIDFPWGKMTNPGWPDFCFYFKVRLWEFSQAKKGKGMGKHHQLVNDPRIMEPLEEFLRTVREVVQLPELKENKVEDFSPHFLSPRKNALGFNRWW